MRQNQPMEPRRLSELRRPAEDLAQHLGNLAEVRPPGTAEEPILAPPVRAALHAWLTELNAAADLEAAGLKPRSTALLYGPPGCGKTTLAHHLAARLGYPLVLVGPENIISSGWGEAEKKAADLFNRLARASTPAVVLLDELEALGGHRDKNTGGSADNARTSLLGVFLRRLEAYEGLLIGATNRKEDIDPALWRRFHLQIEVALPDPDSRFAILKRYGLPFDFDEATLDHLALATEGAAPSLLRQLMEGLKRRLVLAARAGRVPATAADAVAEILSAVRPAPEYELPPLWSDSRLVQQLQNHPWPPEKGDG